MNRKDSQGKTISQIGCGINCNLVNNSHACHIKCMSFHFVQVYSRQNLDFQRHMSWSFLCSVKMRETISQIGCGINCNLVNNSHACVSLILKRGKKKKNLATKSRQNLDFQRHMSWSFLCSVKMRGY
jgi:hypothetical protein